MSENELTSLPYLDVDRPESGVVVLTLADHPRRNVMSDEMTASWVQAIDALTREPGLRAVVVTGQGSAFCSGGDLGWLSAEPDATVDELRARMLPFYRAWLSIRRLEVPTIAAINGPAIGAGLCVAMACDLRYAASSARMGAPFVKLGLHPGMASTWLFPDVLGPAVARDLLLTGRLVRGEEAVSLGLVSRVIQDEGFLDEVVATATGIAANAPVATRLTKLALGGAGHRDIEAALQWEALAQPVTMATADLHEGIAAAQEKRSPRFEGR
ncbi:enoyl-CoA hydratase [Nocardioides daedukensis]|uniref:Enoyl-CoA hydratase n=1 Tax=Nocardioides daedukensis TaxID=634462 RepID=A0A7Y9URL7_9ACTN|nr:enoyl-CoA hydratase-related protein [Nocardioides daedukensis]NYG60507.1 enoyl-CoA hydratase [Nocardioides daedukensis]